MTGSGYIQLLDLACGAFLLTGVLVLWYRDLSVIIRVFTLQGVALAAVVAVQAGHEGSAELAVVAAGMLLLRAVALPLLLRRALVAAGPGHSESRPLVNVATSLLAAAVLTMIAYAVSRPLVALAPTPATHAVPAGLTVVLIGLLVLVTRRRALSQVVGFLLVDNGITAVAFLTATGIPLLVELGVSLDVLFAVLVLQTLAGRLRDVFGDVDLDELRELHD